MPDMWNKVKHFLGIKRLDISCPWSSQRKLLDKTGSKNGVSDWAEEGRRKRRAWAVLHLVTREGITKVFHLVQGFHRNVVFVSVKSHLYNRFWEINFYFFQRLYCKSFCITFAKKRKKKWSILISECKM